MAEGKREIKNIGPIKDSSGVIYSENTLKANALNSFFVNVGKSLSNSTQENSSIPSSQPTSNKKEISTLILCNIAFNNDFLKYAFKCMKNGKSSDPGSISRNELRLTGDTLLDYFMPLGQRSI